MTDHGAHGENDIEAEERKVRQLRSRVDLVCALLYQEKMSLEEASRLIRSVKQFALELFPDREQTFERIYGSRLRRILSEKFPRKT